MSRPPYLTVAVLILLIATNVEISEHGEWAAAIIDCKDASDATPRKESQV